MPNQIQIINAVNLCLKRKFNTDFELNKTGICSGLASLNIKYTLENKASKFFSLLQQLAAINTNYHLGDNAALDEFIIQIEKTFNPDAYTGHEVQQSEIEKILSIGNKPLANEFNLGLCANESIWKELLKQISRNNRSYFIASKNHAIALSFKNGKYSLYDPNYDNNTHQFDSVDELLTEIKACLGYKDSVFGLSIRVFANPNATPEHYPNTQDLHQIAFANDVNLESSAYAAVAKDPNTLNYLFHKNKIKYDSIGEEYCHPEFNTLLLQQPKTPGLREAILKGALATLYVGNNKEAEQLINHYLGTYSTPAELNELKSALQNFLSSPLKKCASFCDKEANYTNLLKIFNQLALKPEQNYQTNYNHLQLLTFMHQEIDGNTIHQFLSALSPEQVIKQIQCAAITNQHHVLNVLIKHLIHVTIDPKLVPSIFNKELIEKIHATTLKRLLDQGFVVNIKAPDLLSECLLRKDKTIFELYARAWLEQTSRSNLWTTIEKHRYDLINLEELIGPVSLLNALIFLNKNEHVKKAWNNKITDEMIQGALITAISCDNTELALFLQQQIQKRSISIDEDALEFLYKKGLEGKDLSTITLLVELNFNILGNTKDIRDLFRICKNYQDYSIITTSFEKAVPRVKQIIFENSLKNNVAPVLKICMQEPQLFNTYLHKLSEQPSKLALLNNALSLQKPNTVFWKFDAPAQKKLVKSCFKNDLSELVSLLFGKVTWEDVELLEFLHELIQEKNEKGIILFLKTNAKLKENPKLLSLLLENNLLNTLDFLITKELIIERDVTENIFINAIANNHKNLIVQFLEQERITPQTELKQPLVPLLKQAIVQGNASVLEAFIQSHQDFGLNFKELFLFSCEQKQAKIANLLLAKEFVLSNAEKEASIEQLFGKQSPPVLFETMYLQAYGRLYQLLLKTDIQNPRNTLLNSIKDPELDLKFQHTDLYLNPLKRAIKEKNATVFEALFTQNNLPAFPDNEILSFLKDPVLFASVFPLFEQKYTFKLLLAESLKHHEWAVVALLMEQKQLNDLDIEMQQILNLHASEIIKMYCDTLEAHYDKIDVRPQLFKLLDSTHKGALPQLATPYRTAIQTVIERIELNMLKNHLDLNNQIYRYQFSNKSFQEALEEVAKIFDACQKTIVAENVRLDDPIENQKIINFLTQIKLIMEGHDIVPSYLSEESTQLLQQLIQNPRFKRICELEVQLYYILKQLKSHLGSKTIVQEEFNNTIKSLHECLEKQKLPHSFVLPIIQPYLESFQTKLNLEEKPVQKKQELQEQHEQHDQHAQQQHVPLTPIFESLKSSCNMALNYYLEHRTNTLNIFSYCFDYYRGQTRANHYKNLINSATTKQELYIIEYALLVNGKGAQLKKDMILKLNFENDIVAKHEIKSAIKQTRHSLEDLAQLDRVIASINKKINANDTRSTEVLFRDELDFLSKLHTPKSALTNNSIFKTKIPEQQSGFWNWIANCLGYKASISEENSLSL